MADDPKKAKALYEKANTYPSWNKFILSPDGYSYFDMSHDYQQAFKDQYFNDRIDPADPDKKTLEEQFLNTQDITPAMRQDPVFMGIADVASGMGLVGRAWDWLNRKYNPRFQPGVKQAPELSKTQLQELLPSYQATGTKGGPGIYSPAIHTLETPVIPKAVPLLGGANAPSIFGFNPEEGLSGLPKGVIFNLVAGEAAKALAPIASYGVRGAMDLVGSPVAESLPKRLVAGALESSLTGGGAMAAGQEATGGSPGQGFVAGALMGPAFEAANIGLKTGYGAITGNDTPFMVLKDDINKAKSARVANENDEYKRAMDFMTSHTTLTKAPPPEPPKQGSLLLSSGAVGQGTPIAPTPMPTPDLVTTQPDPLTVPHEAIKESIASQLSTEPAMPLKSPILPDTLSTTPKPEPISETNIPILKGDQTQSILQNRPIDYEYVVAPFDNVVTSHSHETFSPNKEYPQSMQQRDRALPSYRLQVEKMANNIIPQLLADSPEVTSGAPTITDLNANNYYVEAGNGRTMALKMLSPEGYNKYIDYIKENSDRFGLKKEDIQHYETQNKRIGLFRRRLTEMPSEQYAALSNYNSTMTFNEIERVSNLASMIRPDTIMKFKPIGTIEDTINSPSNTEALSEIISQLPLSELNNYQSTTGDLTTAGTKRIRNAMFYKTYGDHISKILFDDMDINIKKITNGLANSLPATASAKAKILTGLIDPSIDIFPDLDLSIEKYSSLRKQGISVNDYLQQQTMFPDITKIQQSMLRALDEYSTSSNRMASLMNSIASTYSPYERSTMAMPGMQIKLPTKEEFWNAATSKAAGALGESLFAIPNEQSAPQFVKESGPSDLLGIPTEEVHNSIQDDMDKRIALMKSDYQKMSYILHNSNNVATLDLTNPKDPVLKTTNTPGRILSIKSQQGNVDIPFDDPIAHQYLQTLKQEQYTHGNRDEYIQQKKAEFHVNVFKFGDAVTGLDSSGMLKWTTEFRKLVSSKRDEWGASVLYLFKEDIKHIIDVHNNIVSQIPPTLSNVTSLSDLRTALVTSNENPKLLNQIDSYRADLTQRIDSALSRYESYVSDKHEIPLSSRAVYRNGGFKPEGLSEDGYSLSKDYMAANKTPVVFDDEKGNTTIGYLTDIPALGMRGFQTFQTHFHTLGYLTDEMARLGHTDIQEMGLKALDGYSRRIIADTTMRDLNNIIYYRNGKHILPVENEVLWQLLNKYANPDDVKAAIGKNLTFMTREGGEAGNNFEYQITPDMYKRYAYARAFFDYAKDMQGIQTDIEAYAPHWSVRGMRYGLWDDANKKFIDARTFSRNDGLAEMLQHQTEYKNISLRPRNYDIDFDNLDPKTLLKLNSAMNDKFSSLFTDEKSSGTLSYSMKEIMKNWDEVSTALGFKPPSISDIKTYEGLLQSKDRDASFWMSDSKLMEMYPFLMNRYLMSLEMIKFRAPMDALNLKYKDNHYATGVLNRITDAMNMASGEPSNVEKATRKAFELLFNPIQSELARTRKQPSETKIYLRFRNVLDDMRTIGATLALGFNRLSTAFVVYTQPFVTGGASELGLKNIKYAYEQGLYDFVKGHETDPMHMYISKAIGAHTLHTDFAEHFGIEPQLKKEMWAMPLYLFNKSESFARIVTGIASYKHATDDLKMTDETQILEYMRKMNREIVHDYSEANLPTLMKGTFLRTWNMFRPFTLNLWENAMRFFHKIPKDPAAFGKYALLNFARGGPIAVQSLSPILLALSALGAARKFSSNLDDYLQKYEKKYNVDLNEVSASIINKYYNELQNGQIDAPAYNLISSGAMGLIAGVNLGIHHSLSMPSVISTIPGLDVMMDQMYGTGMSYVPSTVANTVKNIINVSKAFMPPDMNHDPVKERGGLMDLYKAGGADGLFAGLLFLQKGQMGKESPSLEGGLKAWLLEQPSVVAENLQRHDVSTPLKEFFQFRTPGGIANVAKIRLIMGGGYKTNDEVVKPEDQAFGWYQIGLLMKDLYDSEKAKGNAKGMQKYLNMSKVAHTHLYRLFLQTSTKKQQIENKQQRYNQFIYQLEYRYKNQYLQTDKQVNPNATLQSAEGE